MRILPAGVVGLVALAGTACGSSTEQITVSVASSLTDVFAAIETAYEAEHPGIDVRLNVAGSATLVAQVDDGAPVDAIVTADREAMDRLGSLAAGARPLAVNRLTAIHRTDLPHPVDLEDPSLIVIACDAALPCGRLTAATLDELGLRVEIDSSEPNVRAVRQRVSSGDADVGFVYRTDVLDDGSVVEVPLGATATTTAVIAALDDREATARFVDYATSSVVAELLAAEGFERP